MEDRRKNLELDKICRVCLAQKKDMRPIFGEMIADMLMECARVKIENTDGWPDKICIQCVHSVSRCHAFKTLVEKSDKQLRAYIKSLTIVVEESIVEMHQAQTHQQHIQSESPPLQAQQVVQQTIKSPSSSTAHIHTTQPRVAQLPQQIVLSNGQIINTAQIVTSHGGSQIAQIVEQEHMGHFIQTGNTVQMIQNGQHAQVLQIQQDVDVDDEDSCVILQSELSSDAQYFEDVTVTTHDDIETTEDIIQIPDEDDIVEEGIDDEEEIITVPDELTYTIEPMSEEEEVDEKVCIAEFMNSQVTSPAPGRYICSLCHKEFKQYKWMENHLKSHSNWIKANCKKQPQCRICLRSFKGPGMLRMHMKTHETSEKIPTCTICNKQFKSKTVLYRHRQTHQMKTYSCGNCSKSFSSPLTLNSHMTKKHANEPPNFKCAECQDAYVTVDDLKNHIHESGHSGKTILKNNDDSS